MTKKFDYLEATSRNLGLLTEWEQLILSQKKVAIAGMGGVGGHYVASLSRLGICNFNIADFDNFELGNFNRQAGATISTIGMPKAKVMADIALGINPNAKVNIFPKIDENNIDEFLKDVDIYLDGIDLFCTDARELIFTKCHQLNIPAVTAAPMGMGTSFMTFHKDSMSFEDYFQWKGKTYTEKLVNFIIGLNKKRFLFDYLMDPSRISFANKKGPSTIMACDLCAAVIGVEALKILLKRGKVYAAPYTNQFDMYMNKFHRSYTPWGNKNPIERLKIAFVTRRYTKMIAENTADKTKNTIKNDTMHKILDLARWTPSGDNTQPWRFKIISEEELYVLPRAEELEQDFFGPLAFLSYGCLVETLRLAANHYDKNISWEIIQKDSSPIIKISFTPSIGNIDPHNLASYIKLRSVCRKPFLKEIPPQKLLDIFPSLLDKNYTLDFILNKNEKMKFIKMNMIATQIRSLLEKCHLLHLRVFQWSNENAEYGIPYTVTGLMPLSAAMFKKLRNHWRVIYFFNKYLKFATPLSLETDFIPGINSAGMLVINADKSIDKMNTQELIETGMQIQRIWLYATKNNLVIQPYLGPLIFAYQMRNNIKFTDDKYINNKYVKLENLFKENSLSDKTIFVARFGYPKDHKIAVRSIRKDLDKLIVNDD